MATFKEIVERLKLRPSESGHALLPEEAFRRPDGSYDTEYLSHAFALYRNEVFHKEMEQAMKNLLQGMVDVDRIEDVKACQMSIQALLSVMDSVKALHDLCEEVKDRLQEENKQVGQSSIQSEDDDLIPNP